MHGRTYKKKKKAEKSSDARNKEFKITIIMLEQNLGDYSFWQHMA